MRCEIPVLLRCCFCFPLRLGLLGWAYLKEILNLFFVTSMIMKTYMERYHISYGGQIFCSIIIIFIISDIVLHAFFIFSAHKKDYKKVRIFYRYSIVVLILYVVMILFTIGTWISYIYVMPIILIFLLPILIPSIITFFLLICFQGYLIILVRSEFIKLKNNSQFEFMNHAADQNCTRDITFVEEISKEIV